LIWVESFVNTTARIVLLKMFLSIALRDVDAKLYFNF